jgi:hypothetical protein
MIPALLLCGVPALVGLLWAILLWRDRRHWWGGWHDQTMTGNEPDTGAHDGRSR